MKLNRSKLKKIILEEIKTLKLEGTHVDNLSLEAIKNIIEASLKEQGYAVDSEKLGEAWSVYIMGAGSGIGEQQVVTISIDFGAI